MVCIRNERFHRRRNTRIFFYQAFAEVEWTEEHSMVISHLTDKGVADLKKTRIQTGGNGMNSIEFYAHILKENEKLKKDTALLTSVNELLTSQLKVLYKRDKTLRNDLRKLIEQYKDV